jgi:ABC-type multidrug transport system ATPase subunit
MSKLSKEQQQNMIAFVAQHDAPYYGLTAREILMYQAMLTVQ